MQEPLELLGAEGSFQVPERLTLQETLRIVTRASRIFERSGERSLKVFKDRSKIFSRVRHDPVNVFSLTY